MINKNARIPIYYQLENLIREQIDQGELLPGDALPSERAYAEAYDISRMTVRQAINNLANEGLIIRKKGKGTFIAEKKFEQTLQGLTGFTEDMLARGLQPSNRIIKLEETNANPTIASKLMLHVDDPVLMIERLRLADDAPISLETVYTPTTFVDKLKFTSINVSFYQYVEKQLGLTIGHGTQEIESGLATTYERKHLGLNKGDPVLYMRRTTYLSNGKPFEYVTSAYRADKYVFTLQLPRNID
ncbi:HTH-type transcriptional repressor YvoA [Paraliobacillus sp. PM-2]|uniref:GntR family transcriptional regulator n=1 Tax=Paraliobacillus sp. PM-2 TaxID=1462524 RepID=UPI00061C0179|nr:GntR family transcriptional regulator [Paraliobacillus sp. PM-2]CQR46387.1 HTH-type transcriptional repressor YvoA [Paraliobacillus sp. PM-2]